MIHHSRHGLQSGSAPGGDGGVVLVLDAGDGVGALQQVADVGFECTDDVWVCVEQLQRLVSPFDLLVVPGVHIAQDEMLPSL